MEGSGEALSPFDSYDNMAAMTLQDEGPKVAMSLPSDLPEARLRNSMGVAASAPGRLEEAADAKPPVSSANGEPARR